MKTEETANALAQMTNLPVYKVRALFSSLAGIVAAQAKNGNSVSIGILGEFYVGKQLTRTIAKDVRTGLPRVLPAMRVIKFKVGNSVRKRAR